jgi:hypothetical protein
VETWTYVERRKGSDLGHGSSIYDIVIPIGRLTFTNTLEGMVLADWTTYEEEDTDKPKTKPKPKVVHRTPTRSFKPKPKPKPKPRRIEPEPKIETTQADLSQWPQLHVSGILMGNEGRLALINNKLVGKGETVEKVDVLAVSKTGVYLRYGSETIFLAKGSSTHKSKPKRRSILGTGSKKKTTPGKKIWPF